MSETEPKYKGNGGSKQSSTDSICIVNFGIRHEEMEWIILAILRQSPRRKCVLRVLFQKALSHLQMKPRGKTREELLQLFVQHLRQLKEQEKIEFISAKTKVHVRLR